MKSILLIYSGYHSFVKKDFDILSKKYKIEKYEIRLYKNFIKSINQIINQVIFLIKNIKKFELYYIWFADYHSFIPIIFAKIFRKKSIIVIGGSDAVSIPEIEFGVFLKKNIRFFCASFSIKFADYIIPVDDSLIKSTNYYVDPKGIKIGFSHYVKKTNAVIKTIFQGHDPNFWKRKEILRESDFITIGSCKDWKTFRRKGHDLFFEIARIMPEYQFTLVGGYSSMVKDLNLEIPPNLTIYNFLPQTELISLLSRHKVFTQLSLSEGLPNTLCEAMLCECIPVGSNINGIPLTIGDTGYILKERDKIQAKNLLLKAVNKPESFGKMARLRIINLFPTEKRAKELYDIID